MTILKQNAWSMNMRLIYATLLLMFTLTGSVYAASESVPCWAWDNNEVFQDTNESAGIQYNAEYDGIGW